MLARLSAVESKIDLERFGHQVIDGMVGRPVRWEDIFGERDAAVFEPIAAEFQRYVTRSIRSADRSAEALKRELVGMQLSDSAAAKLSQCVLARAEELLGYYADNTDRIASCRLRDYDYSVRVCCTSCPFADSLPRPLTLCLRRSTF